MDENNEISGILDGLDGFIWMKRISL